MCFISKVARDEGGKKRVIRLFGEKFKDVAYMRRLHIRSRDEEEVLTRIDLYFSKFDS